MRTLQAETSYDFFRGRGMFALGAASGFPLFHGFHGRTAGAMRGGHAAACRDVGPTTSSAPTSDTPRAFQERSRRAPGAFQDPPRATHPGGSRSRSPSWRRHPRRPGHSPTRSVARPQPGRCSSALTRLDVVGVDRGDLAAAGVEGLGEVALDPLATRRVRRHRRLRGRAATMNSIAPRGQGAFLAKVAS
jgi:hypothetical protein